MTMGNGEENPLPPVPITQPARLSLEMAAVDHYLRSAMALGELMRSRLKEGVHYWRVKPNQKPSLTDAGAGLLCTGFAVYPEYDILEHDDDLATGHIRYVIKVTLVRFQLGQKVATGVGSASTREIKYAYRWVPEDEVPPEIPIETLRTRDTGRGILYRAPNPELGDLDNTILKMAAKRAEVDATMKLPGVAEMFAQDLRPQAPGPQQPRPATRQAPGPTKGQLLTDLYWKVRAYPTGLVGFLQDMAPSYLAADGKSLRHEDMSIDNILDLQILLDDALKEKGAQ